MQKSRQLQGYLEHPDQRLKEWSNVKSSKIVRQYRRTTRKSHSAGYQGLSYDEISTILDINLVP